MILLIAILAAVVVISGVALLAPTKKGSASLKVVLAVLYIVAVAVMVNTYYAATIADEKGLDGGTVGWFGDKWLLVLASVVLAIIVLQVAVFLRRKRK